ncbi:MAG TPA: glycosyltransferase family 39 protein [Roseiarcus sp.]|nr:glycosyltransferase family 39 protein [Roseiarcus sp.]
MVLKVAAFVVVWSLYFIVTEHASAIHNDMAEAYAWGREFRLGYNQHPPFWAWVCGLWFLIFPRANWAFALLSVLNAGAGLLGAWALVGRFVDGDRRVAATALLALTPFYSFLAYKYNANSIFLSLWPWTLYAFLGALRDRRWAASLGFGALMGLSLNSKYYALTLAATCLIAALASSQRRRYFRSASPYVSVAVALALWAPHLYWLATSGAPPIRYLERVSGGGVAETAFFAASAVIGAALQQILALGVAAALRRRGEPALDSDNRRLLLILALAPVVLSVAAALALRTKISSNMLIGVFPLSPLVAIVYWRPDPARARRWALAAAALVSLGALALSPLIAVGKAWYGRDSEDFAPRREAALAATAFWRHTTAAPLAFVAGSFRYDNAAVFYSPEHPSAFVDFDYFGNRWVSPEKLAAGGLLSICRKDDAGCLAKTARFATPAARREEITLAHKAYGRTRRPVDFVITAIPPR